MAMTEANSVALALTVLTQGVNGQLRPMALRREARNGTMAIGVGDRSRLTWRPREESVSRRRECPAVLNASDRSNKRKTDLVNGFSDMKAT